MPPPTIKPTTIVAVDMGTTFTSIAWASSAKPDEVMILREWPTADLSNKPGEKHPEGKVDGIRHYQRVPTKLSKTGKWGFDVSDDTPADEVMEWFKLGLYPWARRLTPRQLEFINAGPSPESLVTKFLTSLLGYAKTKMNFKSLPTDFEYVATVPANWNNDSKEKTRTAFHTALRVAGMPSGTIHLLSEPEAAAIYAINEKAERTADTDTKLEVGDTFVIIDAGGGTVDLVIYTITNLNPLKVKEVGLRDGDLAGSAQLNMRFREYLHNRFWCVPGYALLSRNMRERHISPAMAKFEFEASTKRCFTKSSGTHEFPLNLILNNEQAGVYNDKIKVSSDHLEDIFRPTVGIIVKKVNEQQDACPTKSIKAFILVGGFAGSPYLRGEIKQAYIWRKDNQMRTEVPLITPPEPDLAVTRGAIMKGLSLVGDGSLTKVHVISRKDAPPHGRE
ncbi:hypothetical protein QC761_0058960 [Podospora bellae-mahoneyi]|uniref:Uncharacterized protein n=1 Tax=Podospora bellae-mahoneyi TaxID=2093777 RepID=A0ABR0FPL9_9PEZI|nr:hypothetical protein QC761_0058960 [Podospora bellae-mahoneyi]